MHFPEELEDRAFRLFVHRTCFFIKKNLALSSAEKELAELIRAFPELGFLRAEIDVNARFTPTEVNPFALLAALQQAQRQLKEDRPKGINKVVTEVTQSDTVDRETLLTLAEIYFATFRSCKATGQTISDRDYLLNVQELLTDPDGLEIPEEWDENQEENDQGLIPSSMVPQLIEEYCEMMHEEASSFDISPNARPKALFAKLPVEWINAAAQFWQLDNARLKRERIAALVDFLSAEGMRNRIGDFIKADESEVLKFILAKGGWTKYTLLVKRFEDEVGDGYWWCSKPPQSVIGRLRMKGLLFVGRSILNGRRHKVAVIPIDFRPLLSQILNH